MAGDSDLPRNAGDDNVLSFQQVRRSDGPGDEFEPLRRRHPSSPGFEPQVPTEHDDHDICPTCNHRSEHDDDGCTYHYTTPGANCEGATRCRCGRLGRRR